MRSVNIPKIREVAFLMSLLRCQPIVVFICARKRHSKSTVRQYGHLLC